MDERLRAGMIVDVSRRGDPDLLKSFSYDMIVNAKSEERERICKLLMDEIPGLQERESHDGGPALGSLMVELAEKISGERPLLSDDNRLREMIEYAARLRTALMVHGNHISPCELAGDSTIRSEPLCSCGLADAINEIPGK